MIVLCRAFELRRCIAPGVLNFMLLLSLFSSTTPFQLADLEGGAARAGELLDQAGALQGGVTPEHYMRRELAKYRETRVLGGAGGTMIWNTDADDSQS
jgi:hypothetical protein